MTMLHFTLGLIMTAHQLSSSYTSDVSEEYQYVEAKAGSNNWDIQALKRFKELRINYKTSKLNYFTELRKLRRRSTGTQKEQSKLLSIDLGTTGCSNFGCASDKALEKPPWPRIMPPSPVFITTTPVPNPDRNQTQSTEMSTSTDAERNLTFMKTTISISATGVGNNTSVFIVATHGNDSVNGMTSTVGKGQESPIFTTSTPTTVPNTIKNATSETTTKDMEVTGLPTDQSLKITKQIGKVMPTLYWKIPKWTRLHFYLNLEPMFSSPIRQHHILKSVLPRNYKSRYRYLLNIMRSKKVNRRMTPVTNITSV